MKKQNISIVDEIKRILNQDELLLLNDFYSDFSRRCLLSKIEIKKIKDDFDKAMLYYLNNGVSFSRVVELLNPKYLGGFYARPSLLWFPLDNSAKIYPMSLEHDKMSVFRLSAYLKENIVPELLQMALTFTIKRFPSFATTLKKGVFWHYLDTSKRRFLVTLEDGIPCQPLKVGKSGSQSFRVIYYQNRISVEFFHVLTDGTGGMVFLKSLLSEYIRLLGADVSDKTGIWDVNDIPRECEITNEFIQIKDSKNSSGLVNKRSVQMNGKLTKITPNQIIHFKMSSKKLKEVAKKYNTTVTCYILSLMFVAIRASTDALTGEVSIQVPVNMRKYYDSVTVRNFAMYCGIRMNIEDISDVSTLSTNISKQLLEKASKEKMSEMVTATNKIVKIIKYIPLFIKLPIAKKLFNYLGDQSFTSLLSNLGVIEMGEEYKKYISSMDFILGTAPSNRANCGLITYNNISTLTISKMTKDPTFEEKMYELLKSDSLLVEVEGSYVYEH